MQSWTLPLAGTLALTIGLAPIQAVTAAPAAMPPGVAKADASSNVVKVYRYRHHGRVGRGVGIGLGLGIIGGIIASEAYRPAPGYYYDDEDYDGPYYAPPAYSGDPRRLCAQSFRSFEWNTGMYTTYSGERRLCPYLR
jgi:hypothetical protein